MDWQTVNEILYGKTGLTSTTFWQNFNTPTVKITTTNNEGKEVEYTDRGIVVTTAQNATETNTAAISIAINKDVKTQNTYKDMGNGAQYNVAITYGSKNPAYGDIVLNQVINVKDNFSGFTLSDGYKVADKANTVQCKGELKDGKYDMTLTIDQVFASITEGTKMTATEYMTSCYNITNVTIKNVSPKVKVDGVDTQLFALNGAATTTEATLAADTKLAPASEMTAATMTANLQYTANLVNGETSKNVIKLDVQFNNPFVVASSIAAVTFNGNSIEAVSVDAWKSVNIVSAIGTKQIFGLKGTTFGFQADAKNFGYAATTATKVAENWAGADPTIEYSFVENDAYKTFLNDATGSTLSIENGVISYTSSTVQLQKTYDLTVKAVVTFADLSQVTVNIPVKVTK